MSYDINLEPEATGTGPRFPTVKLRTEGQQFVGMLIDYDPKAPVYVYGTTEIDEWEGKPKTQDLLTMLLLERSNCSVILPRESKQDPSEEVDAEPGMVVRFYIKGHNRWDPNRDSAFRNVKEKHGRFQLGDVIRGRLDKLTKIGSGGRALSQDKHIVGFEMRKARPDEGAHIERCFEEYQKLKAVELEPATVVASAPARDETPW